MLHAPFPTPKDKVDLQIYGIEQDLIELEGMRMDNATADFVLARSHLISSLAQRLDALASDIHCAMSNRQAAE